MDDPWTGWLRNALEWLEMADTPRQIFSIIKRAFKNVYVRGFSCIFSLFFQKYDLKKRLLDIQDSTKV